MEHHERFLVKTNGVNTEKMKTSQNKSAEMVARRSLGLRVNACGFKSRLL